MLAREAAPPYDGEGPFALWHFSLMAAHQPECHVLLGQRRAGRGISSNNKL
jgi:hypothetical protein